MLNRQALDKYNLIVVSKIFIVCIYMCIYVLLAQFPITPFLYRPHTLINDNTTQCSPSSLLYLLVPQTPSLPKIWIMS